MVNSNKQLAFYFDQTRCASCNCCTVACKDWNQINPGPVNWRQQWLHEVGDQFYPLAFGCNHCDDPACAKACSIGAIAKDENGLVHLDRYKCRDLRTCIRVCPFEKPKLADDKQEPERVFGWQVAHPAQKCDMCYESRLKNGLKPVCILACPCRALDFGTVDYIKTTYPDVVKLNKVDFPYAYVNDAPDTGPNLFIRPIKHTVKVHKTVPAYTGKRDDV